MEHARQFWLLSVWDRSCCVWSICRVPTKLSNMSPAFRTCISRAVGDASVWVQTKNRFQNAVQTSCAAGIRMAFRMCGLVQTNAETVGGRYGPSTCSCSFSLSGGFGGRLLSSPTLAGRNTFMWMLQLSGKPLYSNKNVHTIKTSLDNPCDVEKQTDTT